MKLKIVSFCLSLLLINLFAGEVSKGMEAVLNQEECSSVINNIEKEDEKKHGYAILLLKNSPFIPFKTSKDAIASVESTDLEFLSVINYASSKYSFCLRDKQSGKRFWLHSDDSDNNIYGIRFYQYISFEKTLIVQNSEGDLISMIQQKPTLNASKGTNNWNGDTYSELLRTLEEDDDND